MFACMGSGKLNEGCDFSWGSPGPNQPWQSGPCNYNLMGGGGGGGQGIQNMHRRISAGLGHENTETRPSNERATAWPQCFNAFRRSPSYVWPSDSPQNVKLLL